MRRAGALFIFAAVIAALATAIWWSSYRGALDRLEARGRIDLAVTSGRLTSLLRHYGETAVLMADHPTLRAALIGRVPRPGLDLLLRRVADRTGAAALRLIDDTGALVGSSESGGRAPTRIAPALDRAMTGALGRASWTDARTGRRGLSYAAPVFAAGGGVLGAVVADVDIDAVEAAWRGAAEAVVFTDEAGIAFIASRSELVGRRWRAAPDSGADAAPAIAASAQRRAGREIWTLDAGRYLPRQALHLVRPVPAIGLTGALLIDTAPAVRTAWNRALVAMALALFAGAASLVALQRRRALDRELRLEEATSLRLEREVAHRTRALSAANAGLRREIAERREAEAALNRAQADLVQAGKMSALGQMSAGISHELNQPLMAIRSFAENAETYLSRGAVEAAAGNLARIAETARRMGRIIRNLRAFARQEEEAISDVDLCSVVETVLEMTDRRAAEAGVSILPRRPDHAVMVRGGEVRLAQVVLNLVTNALDALEGRPGGEIRIVVEPGPMVRLRVEDNGPGIADPARMFEPFYTTRPAGAAEGMGLGLSISYGLVTSFGGGISGGNRAEGGAALVVDLRPAAVEAAA